MNAIVASPSLQDPWTDAISQSPSAIAGSQFLDPDLLYVARTYYRDYCTIHQTRLQRPLGIVVNRLSFRTTLIFKQFPALLPEECFIPFHQIDPSLLS